MDFKLFQITLVISYEPNHKMRYQALDFMLYNSKYSIYSTYIHNINDCGYSYKINREFWYPYKLKEEVLKKIEDMEKEFKEICPNDQLTIIFDKDLKSRVQVIERYWRRYRWNYLRNLAAWKYHPSRLTFEID